MTRLLGVLIILLSFNTLLYSQRVLEFNALTIEDGFSSSKANAIIQDRKGFIWIGTWNGLNRYDGYECEVFKPNFHDTTTISNKEVTSLLEDHLGNIWVGTSFGLNRMDPATGEIKIFKFESRIISLYEDRNNTIWVGTWGSGLYALNPETGVQKHLLDGITVSDMLEDNLDEFWVGTYGGLINLNRQSFTYTVFGINSNPNGSIPHLVVTDLEKTQDGSIWVSTWGGGISKMTTHVNKDSIRFVNYSASNKDGSLASNSVYKLHCDQYGNLWIGTWDAGISLLDKSQISQSQNEVSFINYQNDISNPYGLSGNNITALYVDRSGILWAGSSKLDRSSILQSGISRYNTASLNRGTYIQSTVRSFAGDDKGNLWVGLVEGLKLYKQNSGTYEYDKTFDGLSYTFNGKHYMSNSILSLMKDDNGLWVGTDDAGLIYLKGEGETSGKSSISFYNNQTATALPGNKVTDLVPSAKYPDQFWLGTMQSGFARCTYKNNKLTVEPFLANGSKNSLCDNNVRTICEDNDGFVWIGTQKGLDRYDPITNQFLHFSYSNEASNGINDNVINILYVDSKGDLWIGTNSGLNKMIKVGEPGNEKISFKSYPNEDFLRNDLISNIMEDEAHDLWICFYTGMLQFNTGTEHVIREWFSKEYQRIGMSRNASYVDNVGQLLIGGTYGFLAFDPEKLEMKSEAPVATFTDFYIHNKKVDLETKTNGRPVLLNTISYTSEVKLSYQDNLFTVFFSAMDFKDPRENKYAYILDGYDEKWNDVGNRNSAIYTGVPPGEYILKVKACNSYGVWSNEASELKIVIIPPFWLSTYAYAIYLVFIGFILYFFNKYSVIQIKEKSRLVMEHIQVEKDHELNELKSHFFTNITHEFRTPLTLILGPVEELLRRSDLPDDSHQQINLIQRNAQRLLRLVNQLMEFRKVEKAKMELFLQEVNIISIIDDLYLSFKKMAESKNINFTIEYRTAEIAAWIDLDKMDKALFNLLSNAFKFTEEGGAITIRVEAFTNTQNVDCFSVEVEDTGIGIPADKTDFVFERFYQVNQKRDQSTGGIGLYLTKAFVDLHKGEVTLESELGEGSCFRVEVPVDIREMVQDHSTIKAPEVVSETQQAIPETVTTNLSKNASKKPVLLIVEDDSDMNQFITSGLSDEFEILSCFNGFEALEMASKNSPDLVITDIMMPEMNGYELCERLRKDINTSHIPLVFLTAKTMQEDEIAGLRMGAVDYIFKPFNMLSLKLKVTNLLKNRTDIHEKIKTSIILKPEDIELSSLDEIFLKNAVEAVNKNLDDATFDVEKLSEELGMSSNQAYRKIKALTGQTAKEFIRSQRLKTSANLLLQKKRSISEIIYMVGFSSPSYFTRCFKEYFGCTPSEYIERAPEE